MPPRQSRRCSGHGGRARGDGSTLASWGRRPSASAHHGGQNPYRTAPRRRGVVVQAIGPPERAAKLGTAGA